jgi:hypothetical protein
MSPPTYENPNRIPRLGDLFVLAKYILLQGFVRFFKLKHNNNMEEGD